MPSTRLASFVEEVEEPHKINNFDYSTLSLLELKALAKERGMEGYSKLNKSQLLEKLG